MKYLVRVTETLSHHVIVEANNRNEAFSKVEQEYNADNITLDYDDYCGSDIEVIREADKNDIYLYDEIEVEDDEE